MKSIRVLAFAVGATVLVAGTVTALARGGTSAPQVGLRAATAPIRSTATPTSWRTYVDPVFGFRVRYPADWRAAPASDLNPSGLETLVHLGKRPVVLITWTSNSGPLAAGIDTPIRAHGTATRIDGKSAWILIRTSGEKGCAGRAIDVSIDAGNSFVMSACLVGSRRQLDTVQAEVLSSTRSVRTA